VVSLISPIFPVYQLLTASLVRVVCLFVGCCCVVYAFNQTPTTGATEDASMKRRTCVIHTFLGGPATPPSPLIPHPCALPPLAPTLNGGPLP